MRTKRFTMAGVVAACVLAIGVFILFGTDGRLKGEKREKVWSIENNIIKYADARVRVIEDMDQASDDFIDVSFAGNNDVYVSYFSEKEKRMAVEYSHDRGNTWAVTYLDYAEYGGLGCIYISFIDENEGYLLYCSDPGLGMMRKILFSTKDGGVSFQKVCDLSDIIQNYPSDMEFCDQGTGLILTQNHGYAEYAFVTDDNGMTWKDYHVDLVDDEPYTYIDGVSIGKTDIEKNLWELELCGVTKNGKESLHFSSDDNWATWKAER